MEEWREIIGYEGLYEVSNLGRVRSLNYKHTGEARVLVGWKTMNGYLNVALYKDNKVKKCGVHRLVATAFIPNPDGLPCVNHKDECKTNNIVTNLEFCDATYNNNFGTHNERMAKSKSKPVYQYTKSGEFVCSYPSTKEATRQTGINNGHICDCCNNRPRHKSAGNYIWSFIPPTPDTCCVLW